MPNDKIKTLRSLRFPLFFLGILWLVKSIEYFGNTNFTDLGLVPLSLNGTKGILFSPIIHANWEHLINNSLPVFLLMWALFYFYKTVSFKVFFLIYFIHGFWLWFMGRETYHIGASGLVYGLGSFLFISGIIRKNTHLMAISLLVAFVYGSMVWGIFPYDEHISWEGHLTGLFAGIVLAFYFKNLGPDSNFRIVSGEYPAIDEEIEGEEESEQNAFWQINETDIEEDDNEIEKPV